MKEKFVSCVLLGNHENNNTTARNFPLVYVLRTFFAIVKLAELAS